nr:MAG TPA: hypothetical protein [Caudoviricetes sp.]
MEREKIVIELCGGRMPQKRTMLTRRMMCSPRKT